MKENKEFITACGLIWACAIATFFLDDSGIGFLAKLVFIPLSILSWLICSGVAIYRVFARNYLTWEKRLIPLYFSVAPVVIWFTIGMIASVLKEESTWLVITRADFTGSDNFQFDRNGEYTSWRDSPLGRSAESSGRYERQDSILTLHPASEDGKIQAVKLAIRPYSELKKHRHSRIVTLVTLDTTVRKY